MTAICSSRRSRRPMPWYFFMASKIPRAYSSIAWIWGIWLLYRFAITRAEAIMSPEKSCLNFTKRVSSPYSAAMPSRRQTPGTHIVSAPVSSSTCS